MSTVMKPAALRQRQGIQLSYSVPNLIHSTHVCPRKASNGSTVIVYGYESGLRVVWYAGRRFKPRTEDASKVNGKSKDEPDVIDLDDSDDEPQPSNAPVSIGFEDEEEEVDPSEPYPHVLRHLDIPLGTAARHVAGPQIPLQTLDEDRYPSVLQDNIVLAVACSDLSIRLVTCPLTPPAPELIALSAIGVQIVKLSLGVGFHQDFVTSIAITFTEQQEDAVEEDDQQQQTNQGQQWSFLVASTSCTGSGLLLVHQVPVTGSRLSTQSQDLVPVRRLRPRAPLSGARLSFNTSPAPAERHSTILITIPDASCAKIYQVFPQPLPNRNRRGSSGTMDSMSSRGSSYSSGSQNGKMLISLLPGFLPSTDPLLPERRKKVLDSKWVMGGRAIMALLEDGEFGIWDLEAVGPASTSSNKNLIKGQSNIAGIVGGSHTRFSVTGRFPIIESTPQASKSATSSSGLAPGTPHTRKVRAQGLFRGSADQSQSQDQEMDTSNAYGYISITLTSTSPPTESAVLTYNSTNLYLPSVQAFWHTAASSGKNTLKIGTFNGPVSLPSLNIAGGTINNIALLPPFSNQMSVGYGAKDVPNFVASTSTRLVLFVQPFVEPLTDTSDVVTSRALVIRPADDSPLVQKRDLNVDAMDQILENMESSRPTTAVGRAKPNFGKSVAFTRDEEGDVDMASPSPAKFGALASLKSSGAQRRLFS